MEKKKLIKDFLQWDVNSWAEIIPYWEKKINWSTVQHCLEIGAGKGGLSLYLALKGKDIVCSDVEDPENSAKPLHNSYHLNHLIRYQNINASNIPYENCFDLIIFKSVIGNFNTEKQPQVFREIFKALKPKGKLLFAENLRASFLHQFFRKKFVKWGTTWTYLTLEELKEYLQSYAHYELKTTGILGSFGRNEFQRTWLSRLDKLLFNKTFPESWKYIAYGVAEKSEQ